MTTAITDLEFNHTGELLAFSVKNGASDLHLSAGLPPMIRVDGDVRRINLPAMEHKDVHDLVYDIMNDKQQKDYEEFLECDFSFEIPGLARFRVNAFNQNRGAGAVFRTIPSKILTLEQLNAPKVFAELTNRPRGLILCTGPTGSGKSTTLAAIIDKANRTRHGHIITIEDPIEFLHRDKKSIVNQREVGRDTQSMQTALKNALRQAPDCILIGEIRDRETMTSALSYALSGHLVLATMHANNSYHALSRVMSFYTPEARPALLSDLGATVIKVNGLYDMFWHRVHIAYMANRGKKSIVLDMNREDGLAIARELVARSDVVIDNFAYGAVEGLGLGYDVLRSIKPDRSKLPATS